MSETAALCPATTPLRPPHSLGPVDVWLCRLAALPAGALQTPGAQDEEKASVPSLPPADTQVAATSTPEGMREGASGGSGSVGLGRGPGAGGPLGCHGVSDRTLS